MVQNLVNLTCTHENNRALATTLEALLEGKHINMAP